MMLYLRISIIAALLLWAGAVSAQIGSFKYQGRLENNGIPYNGSAEIEFRFFDQLEGGTSLGTITTVGNWPVNDGVFEVPLSFGSSLNQSNGRDRFLQIAVNGVILTPRQAVTPSPLAFRALSVAEGAPGASPFTRDPVTGAIEYRFNNQLLRFAPSSDSTLAPRITLGHTSNRSNSDGAVVSGGGSQNEPNIANGRNSTIGGGRSNLADASWDTISGGDRNRTDGGLDGGAAVGGGSGNTASGGGSLVAGGTGNTASGRHSVVSGGNANCAGGAFSWAGGRRAKVQPGTNSGATGTACSGLTGSGDGDGDNGTFVWADSQNADFISTGANQFLIRAIGGVGINTRFPRRQLHVLQQTTNNTSSGITLQRAGGSDDWGLYVSTSNNFIFVANNVGRAAINPDTGAYSALSDRRAKRDIAPLEGVLDRLLQLRPSRYRMRHQDDQSPESIGLIAQDVAALFPEVVDQLDDEKLALRYDEITVLNTQALIELSQRHEARLATLQAENTALRGKVAALESQSVQVQELAASNTELETRLAFLEEMMLVGRRLADSP